MTKRATCICSSTAALLLCASLAIAQPVPPASTSQCQIPSAVEKVDNYASRAVSLANCLGEPEADKHELTARVWEGLKKPFDPASTKDLDTVFGHLLGEIELRLMEGSDKDLWRALRTEVVVLRDEAPKLNQHASADSLRKSLEAFVPNKWKAAKQGTITLDGRDFDVIEVPVECENGKPCSAFASRGAAIRVINLVSQIDHYVERQFTLQHFAEGRTRLQRWEAYRDKAHSLYWWEVFVNGALMESPILGSGDKAPCEKGESDTSIGFCEVPTRQLILLHPEAAVRFSRSATKPSELKPALVVELIGWYQWEWTSRTSAEMRGRKGVSLAASYTSSDRGTELGYGPMFHWNDFSFAVTKARGGKWSLVLNVPLGDKLYGRKQQIVDELSKTKKSSFAELLSK